MSHLHHRLPVFRSLDAAFVTDQIAVGGDLHHDEQHAADQLVELLSAQVSHVMDVRREWSDEAWMKRAWPRMKYLHHGIDDAGQRVPSGWFERGVEWASAALSRGQIVYVHCHQGSNRSPSMVLAILMGHYGMDVVDAADLVCTARPHARLAYAEDALAWHHGVTRPSERIRAIDQQRLSRWRATRPAQVGESRVPHQLHRGAVG